MFQGQTVGLVVILGHDPDVHSFHTTEALRAMPLGLDEEACAVVLAVEVSFHACIIPEARRVVQRKLAFLSVEQVQHRREAVSLGAVVAGERSTPRVENLVVVRGGELDELEHLALGSEPLKDVGVVVAGSTLGESLAFFHACIISRL